MDAIFLIFIALIVVILVLGGIIVFLVVSHKNEKAEIFDRYMCKDFGEYKYYKDEYPKFVERKDEALKEKMDREKNMTESERKRKRVAGQF